MAKKKQDNKIMGRPTEYSLEILFQTKQYLANYKKQGDVIPSVAGLSCYLKVARSTIYLWATHEDKKDFSDILGDILSSQENILINSGLSGDFNPQITKLVLGKHGYKEAAETDLNIKSVSLTQLFNGTDDTTENK